MYHFIDLYRSGPAEIPAYVRFTNYVDRVVEIVWLNHSGNYIRYRILKKNEFVDVNTYKNHLWIVFDFHTKDRLLINKEFIFYPKTSREYFNEKYPNRSIPENFEVRQRASITLPMNSLKLINHLLISNYIKTPEEALELEIPLTLKRELALVICYKNRIRGALDPQRLL